MNQKTKDMITGIVVAIALIGLMCLAEVLTALPQ